MNGQCGWSQWGCRSLMWVVEVGLSMWVIEVGLSTQVVEIGWSTWMVEVVPSSVDAGHQHGWSKWAGSDMVALLLLGLGEGMDTR